MLFIVFKEIFAKLFIILRSLRQSLGFRSQTFYDIFVPLDKQIKPGWSETIVCWMIKCDYAHLKGKQWVAIQRRHLETACNNSLQEEKRVFYKVKSVQQNTIRPPNKESEEELSGNMESGSLN